MMEQYNGIPRTEQLTPMERLMRLCRVAIAESLSEEPITGVPPQYKLNQQGIAKLEQYANNPTAFEP